MRSEVRMTWLDTPLTPAQRAAWAWLWTRPLGHVDPSQKREPQDQDPGASNVAAVASGALYGVDAVMIAHTAPSVYRPSRLVTWLRCHACHRGYFLAGASSPEPCPSYAGGRLQPVGLWDLRTEAGPPGMLWRREVA